MKHNLFDVVVVGGGHAGVEAAHASYRMGARVALVTHRFDRIGEMSCNPAIGGIGKGHLVREIDAMGGLMGRGADHAAIQYRLLNRRKGPAVQGPRTQADRVLYRQAMQAEFDKATGLKVIEGAVTDLVVEGGKAAGVVLQDGSVVKSSTVILTAGTFLNGVMHIGSSQTPGGRNDDPASTRLASRMKALGLPMGRLKTGTPPRLSSRSIDWSSVEMQRADEDPHFLSFMTTQAEQRQIECGITHTNAETHNIISENINQSAMYSGNVSGVGPRYCPSIEDKVERFADKSSHQVFLEPEGIDCDVVYPNGISNSLPVSIQERFVRTLNGLGDVQILKPGYAIEYDYVDPRALTQSLELQSMENLFLAGQINGTTGYEEAAAQGLIAGVNATLRSRSGGAFVLSRSESYIGVMIDDLTSHGVSEPYRMFTSRAEFRLALRADNADQRLTPLARDIGLVSEARWCAFRAKAMDLEKAHAALVDMSVSPNEAKKAGLSVNQDGVRRSGGELLNIAGVRFENLFELDPQLSLVEESIRRQVEREVLYAPYLERQAREVALLRKEEDVTIPFGLDYNTIKGLSTELKEKLSKASPKTLSQARRIEGITPTALTLILTAVSYYVTEKSA